MASKNREKILSGIAVGTELTHERHVTIRTGMICGSIVLVSIVAGWVLVKIFAEQSWIELVIALVGPGSIVAVAFSWWLRTLTRKMNGIESSLSPRPGRIAPDAGSLDNIDELKEPDYD